MSLPREQDNVGIHVIIVVPESSYRRARRDLFDGSSCPLIARRGYSEDELRHDVVKKDDTHAWEKVYRIPAAGI